MKQRILQKLENNRGVNRLVMILLIAVLAALAAVLLPVLRSYAGRAGNIGCDLALRKARETVKYIYSTDVADAGAVLQKTDTACPAGGEYYVIADPENSQSLTVVCGLHETDLKLRTRLNAGSAMDQVNAALQNNRRLGRDDPEAVKITLNGETLVAGWVAEAPGLRRGTRSTAGYDGTVAFYMLDSEAAIRQ